MDMQFEFECACSNLETSSVPWAGRMPQGMALEIAHHPLSAKHVVNLVIAINRLKKSQSERIMSSEFRDQDLLNILLENALDEQMVYEVTDSAPPSDFSAIEPAQMCKLRDSQQRGMVYVEETMELLAVRLQGGTTNYEVSLNMSTYLDPAPSTSAPPVALGLRDTNLYLTCTQKEGRPVLQIERVQDTDMLKNISKDSDLERFLFYRRDVGLSETSFMSACHAGWYISTAREDNLPVEICQSSEDRFQHFTIIQG